MNDRLRESGIESSLRYLFYRLVAEGLLVNNQGDYDMLSEYRAAARRAGLFPRLVDHNREIWRPSSWHDFGSAMDLISRVQIDRDDNQANAIYVVVEKATVAESVKAWVFDYGIPVVALRGYASQTLTEDVADDADDEAGEMEAAKRAVEVSTLLETERRPCILLTVGDFDASGDHLMRLFYERTGGADRWAKWIQVGVTFDQAEGLPKAPAKSTDPRIRGFALRYWPERAAELVHDMKDRSKGDIDAKLADLACQVEVEALEAAATPEDPEPLRTLLMGAIGEWWDPDVAQEQERQERWIQSVIKAIGGRSIEEVEAWLGWAA